MQHRGALDHAPAREELDRSRAFQLGALQRRRSLRRLQIGPRGLFTAPGPLEHRRESGAQAAGLFRRGRRHLERHVEQARGVIEGQLGDGRLGGTLGELGRAREIPGSDEMPGDRLGVRSRRGLEGPSELLVVLAQRGGGQ